MIEYEKITDNLVSLINRIRATKQNSLSEKKQAERVVKELKKALNIVRLHFFDIEDVFTLDY